MLAPEHEEYRAAHAQGRPQIVEPHRFLHIEGSKRDEDAQRDDFLQDLELAQLQLRMTDAVRGHLEQIDDGLGNYRHAGVPVEESPYCSTRSTSRAARRP